MSDNHFTPPQASLITEEESDLTTDLASRGSRLGASLIDTVVMLLFMLPAMYLLGWYDIILSGDEPPLLYTLGLGLLGVVLFILVNFTLLRDNGQTIGKKMVGIKIVNLQGGKADLKQHLMKRYLVYFVPNQIPLIGGFFQFINILFIFRKDKRCIHDLAGETIVVRC